MTIQEKIHILTSYPLFTALQENEIQFLAERAQEKVFSPHTTIVGPMNLSESVYLIYNGLVRAYLMNLDGKIIPIRVKAAPYLVGELSIIDNDRGATIESITSTETLSMRKEDFKKLLLENARFTFSLLQIVVKKLRVANQQAEYYFSISLKDRTSNLLKELAVYFPNQEITLSQEELAQLVGATRARVTEVINELEKQGMLTISHRNIKIL